MTHNQAMEAVRSPSSFRADWLHHAQAHPLAALGLEIATLAMIFVVSHEVIPETHRNGHQTPATLGLMSGFAIMMLLDTTLG